MDIAIIATSGIYPIHIGGPANVGYFLSKELGQLGHHITVYVRVKNNSELDLIKKMPEFHNLTNVNFVPISINYNLAAFLNVPLIILKTLKISSLFYKDNYDIVLYNSPPVDICFLLPLISFHKRSRQFIIFHGYGGLIDGRNFLGRLFIKSIKTFFETSIVVSRHTLDIPKFFGIPSENVKLIYNGVNVDMKSHKKCIQSFQEGLKILYVGALIKLKCVDILIKAFSHFIKDLPNSSLYILGDGPEMSKLVLMANELGIINNVYFMGFIEGNRMQFYYTLCDLFVLPSHKESMPISILESMFNFLPIIISDSDLGPKEIIDNGADVMVFNDGDPISLYRQMLLFFNKSPNEKMAMSISNYDYVLKNHSWPVVSLKYLELFKINGK